MPYIGQQVQMTTTAAYNNYRSKVHTWPPLGGVFQTAPEKLAVAQRILDAMMDFSGFRENIGPRDPATGLTGHPLADGVITTDGLEAGCWAVEVGLESDPFNRFNVYIGIYGWSAYFGP